MKIPYLQIACTVLIVGAAFQSCNSGALTEPISLTDSVSVQQAEDPNNALLAKFPVKQFPFHDSTGFDQIEGTNELTAEEAVKLKLASTMGNKDAKIIKNFRAHYRVNYSDNYYSLIVFYFYSENEMFSVLINYTKNFEMISFKEITYDEIAEGLLRNTAILSSGKIKLIKTQYTEESPLTTIEEYVVGDDGKIEGKK